MAEFGVDNKDVVLALAVAAGSSISSAARELNVPIRTAQRRMADPEFRRLVADLREEMVAAALGRMTDHMTRAADTMARLLDAESPTVSLRAARAILTVGLRMYESVDVAERLNELEEELARKQGIDR